MKIGICIGSFNPLHVGHEKMINSLIYNNEMDKVIVILTGDNYHLKNNLIPYKDRYNMLKLSFNNEKIIISDLEKEKYHYTYENIKLLKEKYINDELYLVIGADNLIELNTWKNYEYILDNCNLIVYKRNNINIKEYLNNHFTNYKNKIIIKKERGSVSSTLIRKLLKNNDETVNKYLNSKIIDYIMKNNLYRG